MGARASADSISPKYPLQAQKSVEFAVHPGSTAHGISICPTARAHFAPNGVNPRMSARVTGITGLDKPICPTARTHLAPNGYSQTEYHRPLLQKKQTPNKTVSRQFCPAFVYACSLFRNFHTVFEFAAFGNGFRQFVKVAVLKLYFFKGNMLQIQFFEYTPVEYHICQFYFRKLQM